MRAEILDMMIRILLLDTQNDSSFVEEYKNWECQEQKLQELRHWKEGEEEGFQNRKAFLKLKKKEEETKEIIEDEQKR